MAHTATIIYLFSRHQFTLRDHGYGNNAVPVCAPSFR